MKTDSLYEKYYKLGLEHFVNKRMLGLHRPDKVTNALYFGLMVVVIAVAYIAF